MRKKKCKECKEYFQPTRPLQMVCSTKCAYSYQKKLKEKKWRKEKARRKKELMTHSEWLKIAQMTFNKYIRERDKEEKCISCPSKLSGKYDAGHFFSVGSYPNLRFNENNTHGQCVACNQHKHGNINEYRIRLPERIGKEAFVELERKRNEPLKLSIPEIKELISNYKQKIKQLTQ